MKKNLVLALLMATLAVGGAFAQSFKVTQFAYAGKSSVYDFQSSAGPSNINALKESLQGGLRGTGYVYKFYQITPNKEDAEDQKLVNWLVENRLPTYGASEGDYYAASVERSDTDGWVLFFRRTSSGQWNYFMYYFEIKPY
jgi:hypothetical protein